MQFIYLKHCRECQKVWLGWLGSNQRMRESKSRALPLGYTPLSQIKKLRAGAELRPEAFSGVDDGTRTRDTRNHNPMLYQLNYIHHIQFSPRRIEWHA